MSTFFLEISEERRTNPMKKRRKQSVYVFGRKRLVDVPVDSELYKADNRAEYLRARSKAKHISLDISVNIGIAADVAEIYEETQLLESLREALQTLSDNERLLVDCIYFNGLTEQETAKILNVTQKTVNVRKQKIIKKLRESLIDWL
jgi:RNA polymerase sigma factor (sigma-70 family)